MIRLSIDGQQGDFVKMANGADGRPTVGVEMAGAVRMDPRLRSQPLDNAVPTIGAWRVAPPSDPWNVASPKEKIPPSLATKT